MWYGRDLRFSGSGRAASLMCGTLRGATKKVRRIFRFTILLTYKTNYYTTTPLFLLRFPPASKCKNCPPVFYIAYSFLTTLRNQ